MGAPSAPSANGHGETIPHQFGIMINRMVIYSKGKNLQITIPDNSPLRDQERSLGAGSRAGSQRENGGKQLLF